MRSSMRSRAARHAGCSSTSTSRQRRSGRDRRERAPVRRIQRRQRQAEGGAAGRATRPARSRTARRVAHPSRRRRTSSSTSRSKALRPKQSREMIDRGGRRHRGAALPAPRAAVSASPSSPSRCFSRANSATSSRWLASVQSRCDAGAFMRSPRADSGRSASPAGRPTDR